MMRNHVRRGERGQTLALFAIALLAMVLGAAVVVDGGFAFAQRRATQNAADFAAMAGTRIVGVSLTDRPAGSGTAANVEAAINSVLAANDAQFVSAQYVDAAGNAIGDVKSATSIPTNAFGVVVEARTNWRPFLLGVIGVTDWATRGTATAFTPGRSIGGGVMPVGIQDTVFRNHAGCPITDINDCVGHLTSGQLNIPGGFGWLSFGLQGNGNKCNWTSSLGMVADGGCQMSQPFLDSQIGPPSNSHGCCSAVGMPGSADKISTLTGNEWGDLSFYIANKIPVWVPIWDYAGGTGSGAWYHIVGFGAVVFTDAGDGKNPHAKWLRGAVVDSSCSKVTGNYNVIQNGVKTNFCAAPDGSFTVDVTGEVRLVR
jgi:Flp pilus assembly protein TadG